MSANGVTRSIKDLVDEVRARSQAYALAIGVRFFVFDHLLKDREVIFAKNIGLIECATLPDLALVPQLIAAKPQPLVRRRPGLTVENQNPIAGRALGADFFQSIALGIVSGAGFWAAFCFFGARLT